MFFRNKDVTFINIFCVLQDPEIVLSIPTPPVKFHLLISLKTDSTFMYQIVNLNNFVSDIYLGVILTKPDSLPSKLNSFPFADMHH